MNTLHRYLFTQLLRNVLLSSLSLVVLFLIFDFFDRIDNILPKDPDFFTVFSYFLYKSPQFFVLTLPVAFVIGTLFTYGLLSKNSELTAMRAAGLKLSYLALPLLILSLIFSGINLLCSETLVPYSVRRVKEIYNIDIKKKDQEGIYSQENIWWRDGNDFYSVEFFDSRDSRLHTMSKFQVNKQFRVKERIDAQEVDWINPVFGWNMAKPFEYKFSEDGVVNLKKLKTLPLTIDKNPRDFFQTKTEPMTMTYKELKAFIAEQQTLGQDVEGLVADLKAKWSFPFVVFICALAVFPLSIRPARTGSLAAGFIFGVLICFAYYAIHSFGLALGRAELLDPTLSAWVGNLVLGAVGVVMFFGAEAPE